MEMKFCEKKGKKWEKNGRRKCWRLFIDMTYCSPLNSASNAANRRLLSVTVEKLLAIKERQKHGKNSHKKTAIIQSISHLWHPLKASVIIFSTIFYKIHKIEKLMSHLPQRSFHFLIYMHIFSFRSTNSMLQLCEKPHPRYYSFLASKHKFIYLFFVSFQLLSFCYFGDINAQYFNESAFFDMKRMWAQWFTSSK